MFSFSPRHVHLLEMTSCLWYFNVCEGMYDPYGYDAYGYDDYSYYDDYSGGYDYYGADMSYAMPSPQPMGFGRGRAMAAAAVRDSNMKLLFIYWIDACC